jgi:DNA polymerase (family 10)
MASLSKDQIADTLESIARMLELKGENVFKIRAYTNAARALETFTGDLAAAAAEDRLGEIPGVGKAISEKITELVTTGELVYFNKLKAEFPEGIFEMFELQGLGPKKIKALWEILGITTVQELEKRLQGWTGGGIGRLRQKDRGQHSGGHPIPRKTCGALPARRNRGRRRADARRSEAPRRCLPGVRGRELPPPKEVVGDLDFIVATNSPAEVSEFFVTHEMVESVLAHGATKSSVRFKSGIQADLRVVKNNEYPFALNYFTGSKEHNIIMRQRALARGWTLNEYRLGPIGSGKAGTAGGEEPPRPRKAVRRRPHVPRQRVRKRAPRNPQPPPPISDERDLYRALGLDYVEPELREDRGEFAAAENHTLPDLIEIENLRGTFHNHTTASDGRSSLEDMAAAAQELGLDYLGIADHSKSSFQAHGLDAKALLDQAAKIREMNLAFRTFGCSPGARWTFSRMDRWTIRTKCWRNSITRSSPCTVFSISRRRR